MIVRCLSMICNKSILAITFEDSMWAREKYPTSEIKLCDKVTYPTHENSMCVVRIYVTYESKI